MRRDIVVFDIETVADAEAARRLLGLEAATEDELREALSHYFLEKTEGRNPFPRHPFHQVVAISYAHLIRERGEEGEEFVLKRVGSGGEVKSSERELIQGFFQLIEMRAPQLVSYNGRGFDIPVLKYRAMVHELSCPRWFKEGSRYDSYDARFSHVYHLDLLEVFSDFGASSRCTLEEIAAVLSIPAKLVSHGADVQDLYERKQLEHIRNYCETDVCATLLMFLRWCHFNGSLRRGPYRRCLAGFAHYLEAEREARPHLGAFLDAWRAMQGEGKE